MDSEPLPLVYKENSCCNQEIATFVCLLKAIENERKFLTNQLDQTRIYKFRSETVEQE